MKYNKLVRDRIPEIIVESGKECCFKKTKYNNELLNYIEDKIREELREFKECGLKEEAADILSILDKYFFEAGGFRIDDPELRTIIEKKNIEKGEFINNFVLLEVNEI